ncbi:hypothetical protein L1987_62460 [Smallanthus sonchifolius]|uniref:Uncharacterized protein n=1 Tax=Smallanthus sonchifolius TaxID=185202 RepID=A0ACB9CAI9_9ASTR|nr:hypothetical protein L1987_62460 [Smallanthus sonchifolius]
MDQVEEMMEGLTIDGSSFYWYVDLDYEFDACQFFDFSSEETKFEVQEAERWFRFARDYPPAPYMMKINLKNVLKSTPAKAYKQEAVEHTSPTITTPSDYGMHSSEGRTEGSNYSIVSTKLQNPNGSETEDIKRQKLEIGFLRKATIPLTPRLMTEERARRRRTANSG